MRDASGESAEGGEQAELEEAFARAVATIGRRERTAHQIRELLLSRGFREEIVTATVGRLEEIGALDDARYARLFAEDKRELGGWGPDRIRGTLAEHGVSASVIDAEVELEDRAEQLERAAALIGDRDDLGTDAGRRRALGFLARRGFGSELCYDAIRRAEAITPR